MIGTRVAYEANHSIFGNLSEVQSSPARAALPLEALNPPS